MRLSWMLVLVALSMAARPTAQSTPPELSALASKAGLAGPIAAWCRAEFRAGTAAAFALAVPDPSGGGRYVVVDRDGAMTELGGYRGHPEVSCYSRAEARQLNDTIRKSQTIHGELSPRWDTAVVCGFVEETNAVCWQYSPGSRTFVKVGGWET